MAALIACALVSGCGTTTQRLATEQLLMSDAVDNAISQIDFRFLSGRTLYLDTRYIRSLSGSGTVNSDYIISSLRQQMTAAGCLVQDSAKEAEVVVEPRVGALGTDGHEVTYGIPQSSSLSNAATALTGSPAIPAIPEVSFGRNDALSGIAKIIVFAYDRESREPIWQSGIARAESNSNSTWILGAGPFQKGTIYEGVRFAGKQIEDQQAIREAVRSRLPNPIPIPIRKPGARMNDTTETDDLPVDEQHLSATPSAANETGAANPAGAQPLLPLTPREIQTASGVQAASEIQTPGGNEAPLISFNVPYLFPPATQAEEIEIDSTPPTAVADSSQPNAEPLTPAESQRDDQVEQASFEEDASEE